MADRCLLALVLAASAIGKWWDRSGIDEFGRILRLGLRLPQARRVAGAWVAAEGVAAVLLAVPLTVGFAAVLATLEFGCLTAGAALLVAQRRGFSCTCFGSGRSQLSWWTVLRNSLLTVAALLLAAGLRQPAAAAPAPVALAAVLSVLVGAVLVWQARPLGALVGQSLARHPATRPGPAGSALPIGGRR
ncbi:MAG TPA: MauE/DoxX family redox-associated membrane protein [Jatrophihabitans sp.]|nr:MauE/DoxX family redox-associated membrane protein [Jatrophihabitans sp.]